MKAPILSAIALLLASYQLGPVAFAHEHSSEAGYAVRTGIAREHHDQSIRPQDDFYRYVNGGWLKKAEIPADKPTIGAFADLRESTIPQLHAIIESLIKANNKPGSDAQKIADAYVSYMDLPQIESLGIKPLLNDFAKVDALSDKKQLAQIFAWLNKINVSAPFDIGVHQDNKDSSKYVLDVAQSGLGLPDRDYYLNNDDQKLKTTREKYQLHIEKMLSLSGDKQAADNAKLILEFETALARIQWSKVELRDPIKAYNKIELSKLSDVMPGFDWTAYLQGLGADKKVNYLIISQPSYLNALAKILNDTPLDTIKHYIKWQLINSASTHLPKAFDDEHFAFYGTVLQGVPQQEDRWKRAVRLVDTNMGESLGKLYVAKHFPPEYKAKMEKLVKNLLLAYKQSIDTLDWMSPATKKEAQAKLATFMPKIGYPKHWRDYSGLNIVKGDALGNLRRARIFASEFELNKLGKPINRDEWGMTPQTVNAYYNPEMNEIVFPAAILQAPFFNAKADDAVNYGGIGAVIGHEISHGFDDQGAQYDGKGNLRDWWTKADHEKFAAKTAALVKQYSAFSPIPGYNVNGELTLGENIADNSGLAIAYKAYKISLGKKTSPVIDGYTGEQRFFMGFGQVWRAKMRDETMIIRVKTDPHSPGEFRANGTLRNHPGFYEAYQLKDGDKLYLAPEQRVKIW